MCTLDDIAPTNLNPLVPIHSLETLGDVQDLAISHPYVFTPAFQALIWIMNLLNLMKFNSLLVVHKAEDITRLSPVLWRIIPHHLFAFLTQLFLSFIVGFGAWYTLLFQTLTYILLFNWCDDYLHAFDALWFFPFTNLVSLLLWK